MPLYFAKQGVCSFKFFPVYIARNIEQFHGNLHDIPVICHFIVRKPFVRHVFQSYAFLNFSVDG